MDKLRWDKSTREDGFNEATYCMLFRNFYLKDDCEKECFHIYQAITNFTIAPFKNNLFKWTKEAKVKGFNYIRKNKFNKYEYYDGKNKISFDIISNKVNNANYKSELTSVYRFGKCHIRALEMALEIPSSKVLTGYFSLNGTNFLHSVVEVEKDNEIIIYDWTKNLIISKDDYIRLTGFREVSEIASENVLNDISLLSYFNLSLKAYTLFRDEIIKDVSKNWDLFGKIKVKEDKNDLFV